MASSSSTPKRNYDVFLSFRGEDTRKTFTDHLFHALKDVGIHIFKDDDGLSSGKMISSDLLKAIQESKISIIVFSQTYASSSWCLDELVKIIECQKVNKQIVFPVFYHVDPSHVRKQTGNFAEAFVKHDRIPDKEKVKRWRVALEAAASISGFHLQDQHEADFIQEIVKKVLEQVIPTQLLVPEYLVGLDSRVQVLISLLGMEADGVRIIGIYGMGGIGKTTIAKGLYNAVSSQFDCCCFLQNIRAQSESCNGLVLLQEQLLLATMKIEMKVGSVDRGVNILKYKLGSKKVLIVLDDLENTEQLKALAGEKDWFGSGSRILMTTRDQHLLDEANVDERREIEELNQDESLKLFIWHAFKGCTPLQSYMELSKQIVSYTKGLPLALEVLGRSLINRDQKYWETTITKLKEIPPIEILETLRLSYNSLDRTEKDIFLDIACCFDVIHEEDALKIFDGCGFYPAHGICTLIDRCLLKKSGHILAMHDLLRELGREIVREKHPRKPEKHSRLWRQEEVCTVLRNEKGNEAADIEGIILELTMQKDFNTKAFERMANLRLFKINNVNLKGNFDGLFKKVRWFCWHRFPLKSLPPGFHPEKLVALDMQRSKITTLWQGIKLFRLKLLNLSHSEFLFTTPDFGGVPNLMELSLKMCPRLSNIHPSIGCLHKLIKLNLTGCVNLRSLPPEICHLKSLEEFYLDGCSYLKGLPKQFGSMKSLRVLLLGATAITRLPNSIGDLDRLQCLNLACCYNLITLPTSICNLRSLESLSLLNCNNLERLPEAIGLLNKLQFLCLDNCYNLQSLPSSIHRLRLRDPLVLDSCLSLGKFHRKLAVQLTQFEFSEGWFLNLEGSDLYDEDILYFCCLPVLKELSFLKRLVLSRNMFSSLCTGLGQLPNLKQLELEGCRNLRTIKELPINLRSLVANSCTLLEKLPNLCNLAHLELVSLENCNRLAELQGLENLEHLKEVNTINCTLLRELANLSNIKQLKIALQVKEFEFSKHVILNLDDREMYDEDIFYFCSIPILKELSSLEILKLPRNMFSSLPLGLGQLQNLKELELKDCRNLRTIIQLPPNLRSLAANDCTSLEKLPNLSDVAHLESITLENCSRLAELQGLENLQHLKEVNIINCSSLGKPANLSNIKQLGSDVYSSSPVPCSSSTPSWRYDVFISFRGEDTRRNITDHLYEALVGSGIHTFRDDDKLQRGQAISSELLKAIEESRISIVVFSKNYGNSRWCLDELVKIMDCRKRIGQLVHPVFYQVDPSDVRKQTGTFEAAFVEHEERYGSNTQKVTTWRDALTGAANLSGWDLQNVADGYEAKLIKNIVEVVSREVNHTFLHVAKHPVGLDYHEQELNSLLSSRTYDVLFLGIYGMGGIGKTTVAKYFYNSAFRKYEASCFLANVREECGKPNGIVHLQEKLLSELLLIENCRIANVDRGISILKHRLGSKRVLIVLDDVDQSDQLNSLAGDQSWFGIGSLVMITTRNEHLVHQARVDEKYEVRELNHEKSIELVSWHAFKSPVPLQPYNAVLEEMVKYARGLPLALEVLGGSLVGRKLDDWESEVSKLKVIPHHKIQEKLKLREWRRD